MVAWKVAGALVKPKGMTKNYNDHRVCETLFYEYLLRAYKFDGNLTLNLI